MDFTLFANGQIVWLHFCSDQGNQPGFESGDLLNMTACGMTKAYATKLSLKWIEDAIRVIKGMAEEMGFLVKSTCYFDRVNEDLPEPKERIGFQMNNSGDDNMSKRQPYILHSSRDSSEGEKLNRLCLVSPAHSSHANECKMHGEMCGKMIYQ